MFKVVIILIVALLAFLLFENQELKVSLSNHDRIQKEETEKGWDTTTEKHISILNTLMDHFEGRPNRWPVFGRISSPFGFRIDPLTYRQKFHYGTDIVARKGTPVHAPSPGRVVFAGSAGSMGNIVELEHPDGYVTRYGHLSSYKVRVGEWVKRGEMIAKVGNTGKSTAPHLHYEVKKNRVYQNPKDYLE